MTAFDALQVLQLQADPQQADAFVASHHALNPNGRAFGGQLLGQAMRAVGLTVPESRRVHSLQATFLRGAHTEQPIRYEVTRLLDGSRFSGRHVRGVQDGKINIDMSVSFQDIPEAAFEQQLVAAPAVPMPEELPDMYALNRELEAIGRPLHPQMLVPFGCEMRIVDGLHTMHPATLEPRMRYWMRVARNVPDTDLRLQEASLAYLSDLYTGAVTCMPLGRDGGFYVSSLNQAVWVHAPCRGDEWLLIDAEGSRNSGGRGLATTRVYNRGGVQVATFIQETAISRRQG